MTCRNTLRPLIRRTNRALAATLAIGLLILTGPLTSAQPAPDAGWRALPAETVFSFRMPHTQSFLKNFRESTVAGQRIFTAEKFDQIKALIKENNRDEWDEMVANLEEVGFTIDDLLEIAKNNWGMGIVARPREAADLPRFVMIGWAEMDDADIDRIYAALDKAEEEKADQEGNRRLDLELGGMAVRQYSSAEMGMDQEADWDTPEGFETMTPEQQEAHWARIEKINAEAEPVKIDETHLLVTRMPGRMVMTVGFPQSGDAVREMLAANQDIDWDQATDVESVQAAMANYLESLEGGAADSFAARILAEPDAAAAVAATENLMEFYADGPALIELLGAGIAASESEEDAQQYRTVMEALGLNGLGVIAGSTHFSEGALRLNAFTQMASPREGLLATLDGQTLPAAPPAWVPAGVSYFHLAYDLGKLYDVVVAAMQQLAGPDVMQSVQMGNMMVQSQVQADIPTLLRTLGIRHGAIVDEARQVTQKVEEYDFETETFKSVEKTSTTQPTALVWELADVAVWERVMQAMKNFAPMAGPDSGIQLVDEQGFTGLRMDAQGMAMGIMLGQGKLVLGVGPDITARVLSAINSPPAEDASLLGSPLYRQGDALLNYEDGILFSIQDGGRDLVGGKQAFYEGLMGSSQGDPEAEAELEKLKEQIESVMPSDEDLRASFGVSVGQITVGATGLTYEAVSATPAE